MDKGSLQLLLAQGLSVEQIARRFGRHPSTVSYWLHKHGLEAPNRDKHAYKGALERERLEELVDQGMTIREIAEAVERSTATVRHWLRRYGLSTAAATRAGAARSARARGELAIVRDCARHGTTEFIVEGRGYYRCKRCRAERVARRRRTAKQTLVAEAGGRCAICGYDRYLGSLEFHHLDPTIKSVALSAGGIAFAIRRLREEAAKCVLLCSNCHAEVEAGVTQLPLHYSSELAQAEFQRR